jgi:hypothetical protein
MTDYILLMHSDSPNPADPHAWEPYLAKLRQGGHFNGGSAIGAGECVRRSSPAPAILSPISGYIRIQAENLSHAKTLLTGNPVYEAGGTVEIRELPRT